MLFLSVVLSSPNDCIFQSSDTNLGIHVVRVDIRSHEVFNTPDYFA